MRHCTDKIFLFAALVITARAADLSNQNDRVDPPQKIRISATTTNFYFTPTNAPLIPTAWTGTTVSPDFGHTPFQRAPDLMKPTLTNAPVSPNLRLTNP